ARLAQRMSYARIGGSHLMNGQAAETAAAFSALGMTGGGHTGHSALLGRSSFTADAIGEARRTLVPLRFGLKAAHTALIGPKRPLVKPSAVGPDGNPIPS